MATVHVTGGVLDVQAADLPGVAPPVFPTPPIALPPDPPPGIWPPPDQVWPPIALPPDFPMPPGSIWPPVRPPHVGGGPRPPRPPHVGGGPMPQPPGEQLPIPPQPPGVGGGPIVPGEPGQPLPSSKFLVAIVALSAAGHKVIGYTVVDPSLDVGLPLPPAPEPK